MAAIVITEICPSCQKARSPVEMVQHTAFRECIDCQNRHYEALQCLSSGRPPKECSECHTSWDELFARGDRKMVCHMEAGWYRFMCVACDRVYTPKRRELYGPTEFGRSVGLS